MPLTHLHTGLGTDLELLGLVVDLLIKQQSGFSQKLLQLMQGVDLEKATPNISVLI